MSLLPKHHYIIELSSTWLKLHKENRFKAGSVRICNSETIRQVFQYLPFILEKKKNSPHLSGEARGVNPNHQNSKWPGNFMANLTAHKLLLWKERGRGRKELGGWCPASSLSTGDTLVKCIAVITHRSPYFINMIMLYISSSTTTFIRPLPPAVDTVGLASVCSPVCDLLTEVNDLKVTVVDRIGDLILILERQVSWQKW